ncbi:putative ribonuclease H-like domain-containing protein [Tanacetum coccineum]
MRKLWLVLGIIMKKIDYCLFDVVVDFHSFKLLDESQVVLRAPRKDDVYSLDLKNIVPSGGITCLYANATADESKLWHRRLGHVNFKNINKLIKGHLVRGLPSKVFVNDLTCVAYKKGKQHKASCKAKLDRIIRKPLELLHMDLFGLVSVESINKKREFSVARTPQQNGVAERKNRTLIEAARTIPFGCSLTIFNTLDCLGKFDGKSDEGYFLGYSTSSKAFRVYNKRTKRVEENLHINFLEDQPNVAGTGPNWMFDLDFLTNSMNYIPVSVENQVNVDAGTQDSYIVGSSGKDKRPTQEYILLPLQPHRIRIPVKDVVQITQEKTSENASSDKDVQDSEDAANKEEQHHMQDNEKDFQDELKMLVTQELVAKAMEDVSRQAFEEEKRRIASQKKAAQATSTNQLSTDRQFVSTNRCNTPNVSAASTSTGANADESSFVYLGGNIPIDASTLPNVDLSIDPNMPTLEDASNTLPNDGIFNGAYDDDEDVGTMANFNNMDNNIAVSPIPTLRIHKDHPKGQILGNPTSAVQTRGKIQKVSSAQQALVWILVELPFRKKAIGTKWVFINKRDERNIVVKNKAMFVAQGHRQEEGTDYDEVFAPVARIEAIRLFLAFASYMGFLVYQMDVKSAFLYGTIEEEVYVHQPSGFVDPAHPNKVYKAVKALYSLHQAPRAWYETLSSFLLENGFRRGTIDKILFIKKNKSDIMFVQVYVDDIIFGSTKKSMCTKFEEVKQQPDGIFINQDKYVADILNKFDFCSIKIATTPIESNKPLVKDEDGVEVDVHEYRSIIGSLMYLTASRPDIMFVVCACARFQVTPKASHLHAVKRIFRYLKHQPKLGLWYPRDSPFELEAFSDSDYAGASLDRKSTTGGCQFLGRRLISWQCKKQTIVANSTTEAEYVAAAHCCGQVLWIQNQMMDYGFNFMNTKIHIDNESTICVVKNPIYHSRTKHIEIQYHFIRDCYEKRLIDVLKIHTNSNVADLLTKGFDVTRYALTHNPTIWQTATVRTLANGTQQLVASIDSKEYTITEASVRSKLQLADATGIHNLSDAEIYAGLATLGYVTEGDIVPLLPAMLAGAAVDQGEGSAQPAEPHHTPVDPIPSTSQPPHSPHPSPPHPSPPHPSPPHPSPPHPSPLHQSPPHFSPPRINSLEKELKETKQTLGNVVLKLVKKVKSLEKALKRKSKKVLISESEGEEPEDQGRKIQDINDDPLVSLVKESMKEKLTDFVSPTKALGEAQEEERNKSYILGSSLQTLSKVASQGVSKEKLTDKGKRYRRRARSMAKKIDTGLDAEEEINTGREEINTGIEEVSTGSTKVNSGTASKRGQREGKAQMVEEDIHQARSKCRVVKAVWEGYAVEQIFAKRMVDMLKKLKFEEIKEEFDKLVQQIDTFVPINLKATKAKFKRYGEELQKKTSKKQRFDDKDVPAIREKVAEVKEEELVKRTGKRKKQKARKGINVDKSAQEDSETDKEESVEAMNPTPLTTKSDSVVNWKIF